MLNFYPAVLAAQTVRTLRTRCRSNPAIWGDSPLAPRTSPSEDATRIVATATRTGDSRNRVRPSRDQIDPAAVELLDRHGAQLMATARRYAATPEDAEDAYQRGVEILLTKAPTTDPAELLPWLKTVVKHEAF